VSDIAELRRRAAQLGWLAKSVADNEMRALIADIAVEFAVEADHLEVEATRLDKTKGSCS
jgi:hypothetical protein